MTNPLKEATMTDVDLSEFVALSRPKRMKCGVYHALQGRKPSERRQLEAALVADAATIKHSAIEAWLAARDVKLSAYAINRHRRGACSCDA
jgi:hypothetical protein